MTGGPLLHAVRIYGPLVLLGVAAGLIQATGRRAPTRRGRRAAQITWILMLLVGAPVWLVVAAALGWL